MIFIRRSALIFIALLFFFSAILSLSAQQQTVPIPQPTVPQMFTLEGKFVRLAYNNEGYATLGYRTAQNSIGSDWILLNTGITLREKVPNYTLKRDHLSLKLPNGSTVPLATQKEFLEAGACRNLVLRDNKITDSIDYFPAYVSRPCAIRFFGQPGVISYDQVELSDDRACLGRLFFKVPGGIVPGQYWLLIQFATSEVQVPFRIMTKEELQMFEKKWQDIKKQHEESLKQ